MKQHNKIYKLVYLLFALFVILPLVYTFFISFNFTTFSLLTKSSFLLLGKSIVVASVTSLLSVIFAVAISFFINKTKLRFKNFFKIVILIPLFVSPYILAVAWKDFFYYFFNTTSFISTNFGLISILIIIYTPLAVLIIGSAMANIHSEIEESGLLVSKLRTVFFKIILPLIKPALVTSFVLIFIFSISEFTVASVLGIKVFTTEIFIQFSAFYNHSLAILQSTILLIICILLLFADKKYIANEPFFAVGSKGLKTKIYNLKRLNILSFMFLLFWVLLIISPFIILFLQTFKDGILYFIDAFVLLQSTFLNSIYLAFIGAILSLFIGFVSAYYSVIKQYNKFLNWLLLLSFAIPSIVLGISFIKFYNHSFLNLIYSSSAIIIIAYVGKFSFISSKIIENSLKQLPNSILESAKILGIPSLKRIFKILIPQISLAIFVAFVLVFIFSFSELASTIMLYPPGTEILPIKVFTISANTSQALTSSLTLVAFLITLLLITIFYFIFLRIKRSFHQV